MARRAAAAVTPVVLALAIVLLAVATAAGAAEEKKCGGCTPCVGADCPGTVVYPSPPPPPPYYYYSPPPPASYPGGGGCPPPPGAYIQIGSTPPGKGPLYPQDPGFMPSGATTTVPAAVGAALAGAWWAFFL